MARHVDSTVHQFEEWGLPIMKDPKTGRYLREGRWQIMIHGESYKPIVAEAAKKHKVSEPTIYAWRKHFGQMEAADVKRLKALEIENGRLKKLLAERDLDIEVLKEINAKKW